MSVPTKAEKFTELTEHLRKGQEAAAMLGHLYNTEGSHLDRTIANGWIGISELLRRMIHQVTKLRAGNLS